MLFKLCSTLVLLCATQVFADNITDTYEKLCILSPKLAQDNLDMEVSVMSNILKVQQEVLGAAQQIATQQLVSNSSQISAECQDQLDVLNTKFATFEPSAYEKCNPKKIEQPSEKDRFILERVQFDAKANDDEALRKKVCRVKVRYTRALQYTPIWAKFTTLNTCNYVNIYEKEALEILKKC